MNKMVAYKEHMDNQAQTMTTPWVIRRRQRRRLRVKPFVFMFVVLVLGAGAVMWHWKRTMIYQPSTVIRATPATLDIPYREVNISAGRGSVLHGWYVAGAEDVARSDWPVVLYFQGFTHNKGERVPKLRLFHELGIDVLIFDYRGFGESKGWPTETGMYRDGFAAYFYLTQDLGIAARRIFLYGEGLGGAVALELASRAIAGGVILEGTPVSADGLLRDYDDRWPWDRVPGERLDALSKIGSVRMPVLILHSAEDEVVPFTHAERLIARAASPKELVKVHGSHRQAFTVSNETYYDKIRGLVLGKTNRNSLEMRSSATSTSSAETP